MNGPDTRYYVAREDEPLLGMRRNELLAVDGEGAFVVRGVPLAVARAVLGVSGALDLCQTAAAMQSGRLSVVRGGAR